MESEDIYPYVRKVVKRYGFKEYNFRIFVLANEIELTVSTGNRVGDKEFEFNISLLSNRLPGYNWGGDVSNLKIDKCDKESVIFTVFETWLDSVLQLDEVKVYMRSVKINTICSKLEI